jgi:hypothetical protein
MVGEPPSAAGAAPRFWAKALVIGAASERFVAGGVGEDVAQAESEAEQERAAIRADLRKLSVQLQQLEATIASELRELRVAIESPPVSW